MKFTYIFDSTAEEEIILRLKAPSPIIKQIEALLRQQNILVGYCGDTIVNLYADDIYCFIIENGKLFAILQDKKFLLKERLYNIEEFTRNRNFLKINQSCIINIDKIDRFKASFGGALTVILKNGFTDYISRRQMKNVKERIGFKR